MRSTRLAARRRSRWSRFGTFFHRWFRMPATLDRIFARRLERAPALPGRPALPRGAGKGGGSLVKVFSGVDGCK